MEASSSSATSLTRRCMNDEQGETPNISCYCGLRATLWTSWKETNPGRRFFSCPRFRDRGCGFFSWHDPELSERTKAIINHLKMDNKKLQMEISELKKNNSFKGAIDCNDLLEDVNNSVTIKLSDEICSLNRKFRVAIVGVQRGGALHINASALQFKSSLLVQIVWVLRECNPVKLILWLLLLQTKSSLCQGMQCGEAHTSTPPFAKVFMFKLSDLQ
ncbi:hypothetical protein ZIOFF_069408 [Zingiber officinale]|uniref:GRF-type domain-containing protein n=1 Tax=Zingiber officinale TaxID=94328 RepID=A0A8J5C435_ZINOF|nr:hypothetical protein ZIOFF_069408 [Zingiber officinale]